MAESTGTDSTSIDRPKGRLRVLVHGKKFIWILVAAIVTGLVGVVFTTYGKRTRTVSYQVTTSDGQIKVNMPDHKLTVFVDDKPVSNLSTVHVVAYNTSDSTIENGSLVIRFKPTTTDSNISDKLRSVA